MMSQPSRLSHLEIFFAGVEIYFLVELDSTQRDLSKNDFFEILSIKKAWKNATRIEHCKVTSILRDS
jgi:hypothetical protein